jgi:hypothetical protein
MKTILEISTIDYDANKPLLIKALDELQNLCKTSDGYAFSSSSSRFGWTFFKIWLKPNLMFAISEEFSDMIKKSKGYKQNEKFTNFITDFFESRGCQIKLKITED